MKDQYEDGIYENENGDIVEMCQDCDGTGKTEVMRCLRPASFCCGGCYETEDCGVCEGSGEIVLFKARRVEKLVR